MPITIRQKIRQNARDLASDLAFDIPRWARSWSAFKHDAPFYLTCELEWVLDVAADVTGMVSNAFDRLPSRVVLSEPFHSINLNLMKLDKHTVRASLWACRLHTARIRNHLKETS